MIELYECQSAEQQHESEALCYSCQSAQKGEEQDYTVSM